MRRAWVTGAVIALMVGLAPAAQADERAWRTTGAPGGLWPENGLDQVTASGPDDVWAGGFEGLGCAQWSWPGVGAGSICSHNAIVRRWNGSSWENRNPPGVWNLELNALDASGPGNVWLSGHVRAQPYLARWDGARWTRIELPEPCRSAEYLRVEAAGDGAWVSNGCTARWQDGAWTTYEADSYLHVVHAVSATEAWASGSVLGPYRPVVARWDGEKWTQQELPAGYDRIVAAGAQGVWLDGPGRTGLLRRDGDGWTPVPKPPSGDLGYRVGDDGSLWTVTDPRSPGAVFHRFDGTAWRSVPVPALTGTGTHHRGGFDFAAVPGTGGGMVAVGTTPQGGAVTMAN